MHESLTGERHDDDVKEETGAPGELGIYPMEKLGFQTPKTVYFMVMCRQSSLGFKKKRIGSIPCFFMGRHNDGIEKRYKSQV